MISISELKNQANIYVRYTSLDVNSPLFDYAPTRMLSFVDYYDGERVINIEDLLRTVSAMTKVERAVFGVID